MSISDKILEKARKLRAMAERGTLHEAEIAAAKLADLMFQHNISHGMLDEKDEEFVTVQYEHSGVRFLSWKQILLDQLAKHNFCYTVMRGDLAGYKKEVTKHDIHGTAGNVDFVIWLYEFLVGEIERLSEIGWAEERERYRLLGIPKWRQVSAIRWKNSFRRGAVSSIIKKVSEQRSQSKQQLDRDTLALVVTHSDKVERYATGQYDHLRSRRSSTRLSSDAYAQGQQAGQGLGINRPMPTTPHGTLALKD